ncbi:MAG: hypothetical protein ACE5EC_09620 [Phycisphaerae bacterium]
MEDAKPPRKLTHGQQVLLMERMQYIQTHGTRPRWRQRFWILLAVVIICAVGAWFAVGLMSGHP